NRIEHIGQVLMDDLRIVSFDEVGSVPHTLEEFLQFVFGDASEETRVSDLVAVQVENWEHTTIAGRVEEFVAVPAGGKRPRLGLTVAHNASDDEVRVVESGPIGMAERIAEFAAFVNAARRFRATWLGMPPGKLNCLNSPFIPSASWLMFG